jgi:hypothetical protein
MTNCNPPVVSHFACYWKQKVADALLSCGTSLSSIENCALRVKQRKTRSLSCDEDLMFQ